MARQNNEFLMAWSSLSTNTTNTGWQTISVTPVGSLPLAAGRRTPDNAEAVMVGFPSAQLAGGIKLPEGQGFSVERANPDDRYILWLALTRKTTGNIDMFTDMACNIIDVLDQAALNGSDVDKLLQTFLRRVSAWQEFMRKETQTLSPEAEIGLIGELLTLNAIIEAGVNTTTAIEGWLGPLDGNQDFVLGIGALEVKSTISSAGFPAHIGSLEQLDDSVHQPLFIVGQRLKQTDSGFRLSDLIERTRNNISKDAIASSMLEDRLLAGGYFDVHAERYLRRVNLIESLLIEVNASFPRLTIGQVPIGVTKVIYDIDLDKAPGQRIDITTALNKIGVL
jgi:hypothetical protein